MAGDEDWEVGERLSSLGDPEEREHGDRATSLGKKRRKRTLDP